jgi:endo-1,4-beta-xylanase
VPETELKWGTLRPAATRFDFRQADWLAEFARENGLLFRGHTLLWHRDLPSWFAAIVDRTNARQMLVDHITRVCRRYAGFATSWDVVNEGVELSDDNQQGLRQTPWLTFLGPGYIELAFRTAHAADENAALVYNDYGLELDIDWHAARRERVLRLLRDLLFSGTPVHALGIQSHLEPNIGPFNAKKFKTFLDDVAALGLKIIISELDVTDRHLPADIAVRDAAVADIYSEYARVVLSQPAVTAIITWGLSDRYSWLNQSSSSRRSDGLPVRGLPLDAALRKKLAYDALAARLAGSG